MTPKKTPRVGDGGVFGAVHSHANCTKIASLNTDCQIISCFKREIEAAGDRATADRAFFVFLRKFAAQRAPVDHALLESEARKSLEVDEPEDLRPHFIQRVAEVRANFAKDVVETLDHIPPQERESHWHAAVHYHETAFDRLLAPIPGEGQC